jgi:hypothetical protein
MKVNVYRCKECGKEMYGQGALAHLRVHREVPGLLADNMDLVEFVRTEERPYPGPRTRKASKAVEHVPAQIVPSRGQAEVRGVKRLSFKMVDAMIILEDQDGNMWVAEKIRNA